MKEKSLVLENLNRQMTYKVQVQLPKANFNYAARMRPFIKYEKGRNSRGIISRNEGNGGAAISWIILEDTV
ncbi:hypothetical protein [Lunatimonas salinarum]|uniref:hypothetical protein n=1 Tax=Lunatimonas salinarum TaxID=1774590 RepID=UPI001ADFC6C4|nr:hypothetical protein [Lunatimonas salinarum]